MAYSWKDLLVVIAVSGVTTLNVFLSGILDVALPTIGRDLNMNQADLQWPINVFSLSYGCTLLFFGRLSDIVGPRKLFLAGSAWLGIWGIAAALSQSGKMLIIFMALEGLGAAANTPAALSIFVARFPAGADRSKAFGALGAGQPLGFLLGIVLGGVLVESRATWRGTFYIQGGLALCLVILTWIVLEPDQATRRYTKGLDWGGAVLSTAGVGLLTYSLADSTAAPKGWATPHILATFILSIVLIVLFLFYERFREKRDMSVIMPIGIWTQSGSKIRQITAMAFFAWWSFNVLLYFCTLYYQQVLGLRSLQTSLYFLPVFVAGVFINISAGLAMNRVPGQPLMLLGILGNIVAPLLLALIDTRLTYWAMAFPIMVLVGGADAVFPIGNLSLASSFSDDNQALAGAIFSVSTRLGTSIGLAVTSSVATAVSQRYLQNDSPAAAITNTSPEVLLVGFRAAGWVCFTAGVASFLICAVGLRGIGIVGRPKSLKNDSTSESELDDKIPSTPTPIPVLP